MHCDECSEQAIIDQPYAGAHRCGHHLSESVRRRVHEEFHRQFPRFSGGTIAVALSGGKDSASALVLTEEYFRRRPNVRLHAITVDEGIRGYRDRTIEKARELTERLGVEHEVVRSIDSIGTTTDDAAQALPQIAPCSFCGVWRRTMLNQAARRAEARAIVLGFNLDDLAQTVLMNLARADLTRLRRMAPHRTVRAGMVPRLAPLAQIPEREVYLFACENQLPFEDAECPHSPAASRNVFREVVWRLEDELPGTRHALLKTRESIALALGEEEDAGAATCPNCGEPASDGICRSCAYLAQLRNGHIESAASVAR